MCEVRRKFNTRCGSLIYYCETLSMWEQEKYLQQQSIVSSLLGMKSNQTCYLNFFSQLFCKSASSTEFKYFLHWKPELLLSFSLIGRKNIVHPYPCTLHKIWCILSSIITASKMEDDDWDVERVSTGPATSVKRLGFEPALYQLLFINTDHLVQYQPCP